MAPLPESVINSPFMKIVLLKCCRTYELCSRPSIYHNIHLTGLRFIFSPSTPSSVALNYTCFPIHRSSVFPDKEGWTGRNRSRNEIKGCLVCCVPSARRVAAWLKVSVPAVRGRVLTVGFQRFSLNHFFFKTLSSASHPTHTWLKLWVIVMTLRNSDQEGKEGDLKVCHVWELATDTIPGFTAVDDGSVMRELSGIYPVCSAHAEKWHWLQLSRGFFSLWVLMQRCLVS